MGNESEVEAFPWSCLLRGRTRVHEREEAPARKRRRLKEAMATGGFSGFPSRGRSGPISCTSAVLQVLELQARTTHQSVAVAGPHGWRLGSQFSSEGKEVQ